IRKHALERNLSPVEIDGEDMDPNQRITLPKLFDGRRTHEKVVESHEPELSVKPLEVDRPAGAVPAHDCPRKLRGDAREIGGAKLLHDFVDRKALLLISVTELFCLERERLR